MLFVLLVATMPLIRKAVLSPERRNPCTHMTMTRIYDVYGSFKCIVCQKHPSIGWLYRCTQDTGGFLPESEFTDHPSHRRSRLDREVATHSLSSSVIRAIGEGHYTDDQVKRLIDLKEGVRELVMSQHSEDGRPATSSTFGTASSSSSSSDGDCTFSTMPQSTTFSTNSSTSLDEEIKQAYDWKELQKVWMSEPSMTPPEPRIQSSPPSLPPADPLPPRPVLTHVVPAVPAVPILPLRQPCTFKICATCRPTYRERAYQSLENVLNKPVQMPPIWEMQNRRVSDVRIVAGIGLPKLDRSRFYSQQDLAALLSSRTLPGIVIDDTDNEEDYLSHPTDETVANVPEDDSQPVEHGHNKGKFGESTHIPNFKENNPNISSDKHSVRKSSGFRHSVRNVLTRARREDVTTEGSSTNIPQSGIESQAQQQPKSRASSSLIFRRRRSRASTFSFVETPGARVVDTSPLQDSVMLMVATNTPLPQTPGMHGFNCVLRSDGDLTQDNTHAEESYLPPMHMITQA